MKWKLAAVSVAGQSHVADGADCEDAFFVGQADNGFVVGVVSDGAGSARFGGRAAALICGHFQHLCDKLAAIGIGGASDVEGEPDDPANYWAEISKLLETTLNAARTTLLESASADAADPADFLATVVGAIAHPLLGATVFHIGDGAATVFDAERTEIFTSQPENGEYLNLTYFLIENHWQEHLRGQVLLESVSEIFVMTDGVTDLAYVRTGRTLSPEQRFFHPLSEFLCRKSKGAGETALTRTLDSDGARERVDDDKTIVWMKLLDHVATE